MKKALLIILVALAAAFGYTYYLNRQGDVDQAYVKANLGKPGVVVVDVRSTEIFNGESPREGIPGGHIARTINFPLADLEKAGAHKNLGQYFAALTNMRSVGVMGDFRTYDYAVALRSVQTSDFMTADWSRIPYEVLDKVSVRIVNEVRGVNRILYDITSKPPATVEFE